MTDRDKVTYKVVITYKDTDTADKNVSMPAVGTLTKCLSFVTNVLNGMGIPNMKDIEIFRSKVDHLSRLIWLNGEFTFEATEEEHASAIAVDWEELNAGY